jgi:Putative threonine efflux protein
MMSPIAFTLAVLTLLATPGPTNTLLAASGACVGMSRSLKLLLAEIGAYLVSIVTLSTLLGEVVQTQPLIALGLKLTASLWLVFCAVRLWRQARQTFDANAAPVAFRRVFVTTLVNPKALIFAFVIIPQGSLGDMAPWLAAFACLTVFVGASWIALGTLLARSAGGRATPQVIWRIAAVALATFATIISGSAIAAIY